MQVIIALTNSFMYLGFCNEVTLFLMKVLQKNLEQFLPDVRWYNRIINLRNSKLNTRRVHPLISPLESLKQNLP